MIEPPYAWESQMARYIGNPLATDEEMRAWAHSQCQWSTSIFDAVTTPPPLIRQVTLAAHDDARYAAALAAVEQADARLTAVLIRARVVIAEDRRPRCECCGARFTPRNHIGRRQVYCRGVACVRLRRAREVRRWRLHVHALRLDRGKLGREMVCRCGATLEVEVLAGGAVVDRCPVCGTLTPTRPAA